MRMNLKISAIIILAASLAFTAFKYCGSKLNKPDVVPLAIVKKFSNWRQLSANKSYRTPSEMDYRKKVYFQNHLKVDQHMSSTNRTYNMSLNLFADLTHEEFLAKMNKPRSQKVETSSDSSLVQDQIDLPRSLGQSNINWSSQLQTTSVMDSSDEGCQDNYAWVATIVYNANFYIKRGTSILYKFSPQTYIDCSSNYGNRGCTGGTSINSFMYSMTNGIDTLSDYPYYGTLRPCRASFGYFKSLGLYKVPSLSNTDLLNKLAAKNVIAVSIDLAGGQFYSGGIFSGPCGSVPTQELILYGAGNDGVHNYWNLMNTWGSGWGENGNLRLVRYPYDNNKLYSSCGVNMNAAYPTF